MTTPQLQLPELAASQSQPHVTVNSALRRLDGLVQLSVISMATNTPPGAPSEGDRYIVGTSPTGAWAGRSKDVTIYIGGAWVFLNPADGWLAFNQDDGFFYYYEAISASWSSLATGTGGGSGSPTSEGLTAGAALMFFQTDFLAGETIVSTVVGGGDCHYVVANGGSINFSGATADRPGVLTMGSGASNNAGVAGLGFTDNINAPSRLLTLPTSDDLVLDYLVKVSTVSATNFYWIIGLVDDYDAGGSYVRMVLDSGVVKLQVKSAASTSEDNFDTEPTAGAWHHLQIRANSTSVRAYMDGALQATVTTNIPTAGMFPVFQVANNAGLGNGSIEVDFFRVSRTFATTRSATL